MKITADTNVLVSAFLARGLCADLLRLVLTEHTLVTSEVVLAELRDVLSRKSRPADRSHRDVPARAPRGPHPSPDP